jgi:hypothetical protein
MMIYPVRLALAAALMIAVAAAQETVPASPSAASTPAGAPAFAAEKPAAPIPAAPKRKREVSDEVTAMFTSGMPKYNPPPPPKPVEIKPEENQNLTDADKPKNAVVRLPSVQVQGNRAPIFRLRERDINTEKGLSQIAMQRHPGLDVPVIGFLNRPIALQMYRDEARLSDIDELRKDASDAQAAGDTAGSDYIRRTGAETFVRHSDIGLQK